MYMHIYTHICGLGGADKAMLPLAQGRKPLETGVYVYIYIYTHLH